MSSVAQPDAPEPAARGVHDPASDGSDTGDAPPSPPPSWSVQTRRTIAVVSAVSVLLMLRRSRSFSSVFQAVHGAARRAWAVTQNHAFTDVLASVLMRVNIPVSRWLASFVLHHRTIASVAVCLSVLMIVRYQIWLRRLWRRMTRSAELSPADALTEYPLEDVHGIEGSEDAGGLETSRSDAAVHALAHTHAAASPAAPSATSMASAASSPTLARESSTAALDGDVADDEDDITEDEAQLRSMVSVMADAARRGRRSVGRAGLLSLEGLHGHPEAEVLRFLRMMRHTIGGMDTRAVLSLYPQMERLRVPAGSDLFAAGADASDGMYIILKGTVGVYPPAPAVRATSVGSASEGLLDAVTSRLSMATSGESRADHVLVSAHAVRPLCTFTQAQTVGENALLATTAVTSCARAAGEDGHASAAHASVPLDATRPVTCRALEDTVALRLNRGLFTWFSEAHPHAVVSFVLTTTTRQWRVAYYLLVDFLHLRDAWLASLEPPASAPAFRWVTASGTPTGAPQAMNGTTLDGSRASPAPEPASSGTSTPPHAVAQSSILRGQRAVAALSTPPRPRGALAAATPSPPLVRPTHIGMIPVLHEVEEAPEPSKSEPSSDGSLSQQSQSQQQPDAAAEPCVHPNLEQPVFPPCVPVRLTALRAACSSVLLKQPGEVIYSEGADADSLYVIVSGTAACHVATRPGVSGPVLHSKHVSACHDADIQHERAADANTATIMDAVPGVITRLVRPGCIAGGQSCLVGLPHRDTLTAISHVKVALFSRRLFASLADNNAAEASAARVAILVEITLAVARTLVPLLRMFLSLGLQRLWLKAGDVLFQEGDPTTDGLYVVISGRLRTYTGTKKRGQTIAESAGVLDTGQLPVEISQADSGRSAEAVREPQPQTTEPSPQQSDDDGSDASSAEEATSDTDDEQRKDGAVPAVRTLPKPRRLQQMNSFRVGAGGKTFSSLQLERGGSDGAADGSKTALALREFVPNTRGGVDANRRLQEAHVSSNSIRVDVGRGETVGELSVIVRQRKRTLTAVCSRDCELVRMTQAAFELIGGLYPSVMAHFSRVLARRYQELTSRVAGASSTHAVGLSGASGAAATLPRAPTMLRHHMLRAASSAAPSQYASAAAAVMTAGASALTGGPSAASFVTIAVLPAGPTPASLSEFTIRLVAALERIGDGPVLHLTPAKLDACLGDGTAARLHQLFIRAKVGAWLSSQEERHRFIVFEADSLPPSSDELANMRAWDPFQRQQPGSPGIADVLMTTLRGATQGVGQSVHTLGSRVDQAVRAGIGVSPAALLSRAATAVGSMSASETDKRILEALQAAAGRHSAERLAASAAGPPRRARRRVATAWTRLCVQQADLCFLVGHAGADPQLSSVERECVFRMPPPSAMPSASSAPLSPGPVNAAERHQQQSAVPAPSTGGAAVPAPPAAHLQSRGFCRKELVLLHFDPQSRPKGTRRWLRARRVAWHHHIRTWQEEDFNRLARHVCGKSRALILGGGGSRGLAHLGMLQVLEQRGIGIDVVGGTSQGSFMAACYAMTLDTRDCVPLVRRLASAIGNTWNLITAFTLPVISYFSGQAFNEALQDCFRDTQIEDTWVRFFCVSTDVTNGTLAVHTTGPLWRYCRASMTVMGLLPPLWDQGRILIDGGYINNLPVEVARALAPQVSQIIACDVENKDNSLFEGIDNYGETLSGWFVAWKWVLSMLRVSPPLKIPPLSEVALKVSYISHSMMIRELLTHSDDSIIYIRPDVGTRFKLLDYHLMPVIVAAGVDAANSALDRWEARQRHRMLKALQRAARAQLRDLRRQTSERGASGSSGASSRIGSPGAMMRLPPPPEPIVARASSAPRASGHVHGITPVLAAIAENSVASAPDPTFGLGARGFDPSDAASTASRGLLGGAAPAAAGLRMAARGSVVGGNLVASSSLHSLRTFAPPLPATLTHTLAQGLGPAAPTSSGAVPVNSGAQPPSGGSQAHTDSVESATAAAPEATELASRPPSASGVPPAPPAVPHVEARLGMHAEPAPPPRKAQSALFTIGGEE